MGEDMEEFYNEFESQFLEYCKQIFEIGQKHYKIRTDEIELFFKTVNKCKKENQQKGIKQMEAFIDKKNEVFFKVNKLQDLLNEDKIDDDVYKPKLVEFTKEFEEARHQTWKGLMSLELTLFEQKEDVNQNFDQVISEYNNLTVTNSKFNRLNERETTLLENFIA